MKLLSTALRREVPETSRRSRRFHRFERMNLVVSIAKAHWSRGWRMSDVPARLAAVCLATVTLCAVSSCAGPESAEDLTPSDGIAPVMTKSSGPDRGRSVGPSATAGTSCTSNYEKGAYSLDIILQNNTGETLTLDPTRTGRGNGHWAAQPPSTLAPGACAVINAYSDDPIDQLWVTATYLLPDGTFIPFACESLDITNDPPCNESALLTMTETTYQGEFDGTVSDAWQIETVASLGKVHKHFSLAAETK